MKHVDVSNRVMQRVVDFERRHVVRFKVLFFIISLFLVVVSILVFSEVVVELNNRGSWDLLTLFGEEPEIVQEFWKDTLFTFWEEIPQGLLFTGLGILAFLVFLRFILHTIFRSNDNKMRYISQFLKKGR